MPRLISCTATLPAILDQTKTVTRRLGWWTDRNGRPAVQQGDHLTICGQIMGRKPGQPLIRYATVPVIDVTRERLDQITDADVDREGVTSEIWDWRLDQVLDGKTPASTFAGSFVEWYCDTFGCGPEVKVTRIEWTWDHALLHAAMTVAPE